MNRRWRRKFANLSNPDSRQTGSASPVEQSRFGPTLRAIVSFADLLSRDDKAHFVCALLPVFSILLKHVFLSDVSPKHCLGRFCTVQTCFHE